MDFSIAVPLTDLFLAMLVAFGLAGDIKECKLDSEGSVTTITRTVGKDSVVVALTDTLGTTRYTFRGTRVALSSQVDNPAGGKAEATGSYDLKKEFGIADPKVLAKAAEVALKANGKTVTMKLARAPGKMTVTASTGDPEGVFGYSFPRTDGQFPPATVTWK
jgi:hypothetical protein